MRTIHEYLRHAEECDVLARKATSVEQREQIVKMAQTWRMLAEDRRKKLAKLGLISDDAGALARAELKEEAEREP